MESDADLSPAVPIDPPESYPYELCLELELDDGARIDIRPIVPADMERIRHAFLVGDTDSIRRRFLTGAPPSDESHLHYLAEVDYEIENVSDAAVGIHFVVTEGKKLKLRNIHFIGNEEFSDRELRNGFQTKMVRPLSLYQAHENTGDVALVGFHDTYHAPLNPLVNSVVLNFFKDDFRNAITQSWSLPRGRDKT